MESSMFGGLILIILVLAIASFVWWIVAVVDMVKRPEHEWAAARQDRTIWMVGVIVGGLVVSPLIAALVYWFVAKPKLDSVAGPRY